MAINRLQVAGVDPKPDRPSYNLVAGTGVSLTAADDSTNNVSKCTVAFSGNIGDATVTQATSITTGVTLNALSGVITTVSATTAAGATSTFTVANSTVAASSVVLLDFNYAGTWGTNGFPGVQLGTVSAGSFQVVITNSHGTAALAGVLKIHFAVL